MNYFDIQINRLPTNSIKNNLFNKKNKIPKPKIHLYNNNYLINYNQNSQNCEKCTKIMPNMENNINSYNLKSYGNIQQNNYQDINAIKIKMGFDLINQKINNMESIIQSLNESKEPNFDFDIYYNTKNNITKFPLRDEISSKKGLNKNINLKRQKGINKIKNFSKIEHFKNDGFVQHNYSVQNLRDKRYYNNLINDSSQMKNGIYNNNYNSYYSLQPEKSNRLNRTSYNNSNNLNNSKFYNKSFYDSNNKSVNVNNKSAYSLSNRHIPNQKRIITRKIITNKNFFNNINKASNIKNNQNKNNKSGILQNNYLNDLVINEKSIDNYNNILDNALINKNLDEYFCSFDEYFLSDFQQLNQEKEAKDKNIDEEINKNILKKDLTFNILEQKNNNKNNNFNIYNIVKNDKIIQNNYYETKKNEITKNKNLIIQNQNSISFCIQNKNQLNGDNKINTERKLTNNELTRNKFEISQLKKCSATDLFVPNKINNSKIKDKLNNNNNIQEKKIKIENNKQNNINSPRIIKENKKVKCKDDFYYDLITEKIINATKMNNSYDLNYLLPKLIKKFNDNFEKQKANNINNKQNAKDKKRVRFCESENKIIRMNQNDISTKFDVLNNLGKKIYFKKCNINEYLNKLRNKNIKLKSILINKKEEIVDNSEWDKLYDIINQIAKRNNNQKNNYGKTDINNVKIKKGKFNIKNIESFKKKGKNNILKNNNKFKK